MFRFAKRGRCISAEKSDQLLRELPPRSTRRRFTDTGDKGEANKPRSRGVSGENNGKACYSGTSRILQHTYINVAQWTIHIGMAGGREGGKRGAPLTAMDNGTDLILFPASRTSASLGQDRRSGTRVRLF